MRRFLHWLSHVLLLYPSYCEHRGPHLYSICAVCGKIGRRLT